MMAELDILNGFASKIISDCLDITIDAIRKADKDRKSKNQSVETRIYQVTIDALNAFSYNKYKETEKVYDAAESILKELKKGNGNYKESVRLGLNMLSSKITGDICEVFLKLLYDEICKGENRDLAIGYIIHQGERISEQQQQMDRHVQEGLKESHQNEKYILEEVSDVKSLIEGMNGEKGCKTTNKSPIENRADEYADKWNENVFLNDFNEEDENAGTEIKLSEIYKEECLPHFIFERNKKPSDKLSDFLEKYVNDKYGKKMLLILGQPGIGKSTLITWIMSCLVKKKEDILVYQFATDLDSIDWQSKNVLNEIFYIIGLAYDELENKTLILDGFDEIYTGSNRERILNILNQELKKMGTLKSFSLIITCRENYIFDLQNIKCNYITLQSWEETQIETFCRTYWEKCGNDILEDKIQKIQENKEIFGIPLILYMILALDINIENGSSVVDIYDQIFSVKKGGIYDRCYDTEHRINAPEIKKYIHQISQRISFWIFENNADKTFISKDKFKEICENVINELGGDGEEIQSDTLIGNYFKIKHCEGRLTDEVYFIHRSIYEYFVAVYFFESIHKLKTKEEVAGNLGELLKDGRLSLQILEFVKYKFDSIKEFNMSNITNEIFMMMLQNGMTYYIETKYNNIIEREMNIFTNMLAVVHLWNLTLGEIDERIITYLQYNNHDELNLDGISLKRKTYQFSLDGIYLVAASLKAANLEESSLIGADLLLADLSGAHLYRACLRGACLKGAYLEGADLRLVDLSEADLESACLVGADLTGIELRNAKLNATILDEQQILLLQEKYNLDDSNVFIFEKNETVTYEEYCNMHGE